MTSERGVPRGLLPCRTLAIGVIVEGDLPSVALRIGRALAVELHERYGFHVGGGSYFSNWSLASPDPEVHVVRNFGPDEAEWKYPRDQDIPYIVFIWPDKAEVDAEQVLRHLADEFENCRLLEKYDT